MRGSLGVHEGDLPLRVVPAIGARLKHKDVLGVADLRRKPKSSQKIAGAASIEYSKRGWNRVSPAPTDSPCPASEHSSMWARTVVYRALGLHSSMRILSRRQVPAIRDCIRPMIESSTAVVVKRTNLGSTRHRWPLRLVSTVWGKGETERDVPPGLSFAPLVAFGHIPTKPSSVRVPALRPAPASARCSR